ncbi:uncharacterized protein LOC114259033 [Camellia sinensis]|uniref:uncharacterized protein LOC114259033 n=1 Tax=Camellia sinensis TaxID=4442 RepID=UPI001035BD9B|nr:uncharacterized protein LOC114259033 [Camellia sinensis]
MREVRDITDVEGDWDVTIVNQIFPQFVAASIFKEQSPKYNSNLDHLVWKGSFDATFSISSAFEIASDYDGKDEDWQWLWKKKIPQKLKGFLWTVLHGKLLTNNMRPKRRLSNNSCCPFYSENEDLNYVFRACHKAKFESLKFILNYSTEIDLAFSLSIINHRLSFRLIEWSRSPVGTLKLNIDGSKWSKRPNGFGGLMRGVLGYATTTEGWTAIPVLKLNYRQCIKVS